MKNNSVVNIVSEIIDLLKLYVEDYLELLTLRFVDKFSVLTAKIVYLFWVIFFLCGSLVFCMFSLSFYFSDLLDSFILGFLAVAGLNFLVVLYFLFKPARGRGIYKLLIRFFAIVTEHNYNESKKS